MVDVERSADNAAYRFVLRPNRSLSWRGTLLFFALMATLSLSIAIGFSLLGFWVILPFAGAEVMALGICLYSVARRCSQCEVISISESSVCIEKGIRHPSLRWELPRPWAQVNLIANACRSRRSQLFIGAYGKRIAIGDFLDEAERQRLAVELKRELSRD